MAQSITLPKLGLTMEEGTIVEWFRNDGERIEKGEPLFAVETDKIVSDIEADASGFLQRIAPMKKPLPVGALIGYLHETAEAALRAGGSSASAAQTIAPAVAIAKETTAAKLPSARTHHPATMQLRTATGRIYASPIARRLAAEHGIDLSSLAGSGPGGVILKRDVPRQAAQPAAPGAAQHAAVQVASESARGKGAVAEVSPQARAPRTREATRVPMSPMRRAVAQRMMKSLTSTAQMTGFGKVDMTEAVRLKNALAAQADILGARINVTDLALKAAATVLAEMPEINASIDGDEVITWNAVNIGLAVARDDGLIVPVIRDVDQMSLPEISRTRVAIIEKARQGKLSRDEVEGATFTLSNFGSYGGDFETPILNPPQSALLGIGQITEEPAVRDGAIVIRAMMMMSLTFDHRLIDGALAGKFRARFRSLLEQPALWLATMR